MKFHMLCFVKKYIFHTFLLQAELNMRTHKIWRHWKHQCTKLQLILTILKSPPEKAVYLTEELN